MCEEFKSTIPSNLLSDWAPSGQRRATPRAVAALGSSDWEHHTYTVTQHTAQHTTHSQTASCKGMVALAWHGIVLCLCVCVCLCVVV